MIPSWEEIPVLFQHFFWFYSHPAVYIMILPAMGVVSELITTFSRKTIFGYKAIAFSSVGIAAVSFFVWGHHMFVSGQSEWAGILFSFSNYAWWESPQLLKYSTGWLPCIEDPLNLILPCSMPMAFYFYLSLVV